MGAPSTSLFAPGMTGVRNYAFGLFLTGSILMLCAYAALVHAASVTLEWDRNPEPDVVNYRFYYGHRSRSYTERVRVGNKVQYTVEGLLNGRRYYFAVTAVNTRGLESGFSNEVFLKTNARPKAIPLFFETIQDTPFRARLEASDTDGDKLGFIITKQGNKGVAEIINADTGAFRYRPLRGVTGRDLFLFRVSDGHLFSNVAAVQVKIRPSLGDSLPVAAPFILPSRREADGAVHSGAGIDTTEETSMGGAVKEMAAPGTISIDDLDMDTLTEIASQRCDYFIDEHEEPWTWEWLLQEGAVDFVSIRDWNVLLPVEREHHGNLEILRCILSENGETLTLFLKDTTDDTGLSAGRMAVCDRMPGRDWYVAVLYHAWMAVD